MKNWPELKSVKDIQVFVGYASFYQCFIQGFNKLAKPLTSMLKTTLTQLAGNLPLDMAENVKVGSGISSITRSAENSSASMNMAKNAELGEGDNGDDKMVKQSLSKKPNLPTGYLTSLRSEKISFS